MKKVLVAEDESAISELVAFHLERAGYEVLQAADGAEAIQIFNEHEHDIDIVILDIMMPNINGEEVCLHLRSRSNYIGIIMLTAKSQENDKLNSFLNGADDYVIKPFSPSELVARVDSLYRRVQLIKSSNKNNGDTTTLGGFTLNHHKRVLTKDGVEIELTQVEYQIIEYLFKNKDKIVSRTSILKEVWGNTYVGEEKIVDVNIRRIRMKIEKNPSNPENLITVWGQGYKWAY